MGLICPQAADWGNIADWAAVFAGLLAAGATLGVAMSANRTSKRAAEIAEEAKLIAQQQHEEAVNLRQANGRILGSLLAVEILAYPIRVGVLLVDLDKLLTSSGHFNGDLNALEAVLTDSMKTYMPASVRSQDRVHNLPVGLGQDLADLIGMSENVADIAMRLKGRIVQEVEELDRPPTFHYYGPPGDIQNFRDMLGAAATLGIHLGERWAKFSDRDCPDYAIERALVGLPPAAADDPA